MKIKRLLIALALPVAMLVLLAALPGTLPLPVARAASHTVTNTNDSGAGSLRQAILDADDGDVIEFGLAYPATITLTGGQLEITKTLTISGPGASDLAISGNNTSRVISTSGVLTITGVTIRDGKATGNGGGVYNQGTLLLDATDVISNYASGSGSGVYVRGGTTTVLSGTIENNGTGIYVDGSSAGSLLAHNTIISGSLTAGLVYAATSDAFAITLGGTAGGANTFRNNGPSGGVNITVTATSSRLPINAFYNDWGVTGLANIEAMLHHQFDNPSLARVNYYTLTLNATPSSQVADGLSPVTLTATLTGTLNQQTGEVISFTASLGALSAITDTTDANHQASVVLTSTTAGTALVTATTSADPLTARPGIDSVLFQNAAPVAVDDTASTDEDTPVTISVLANDSDPNSDPLSIGDLGTPVTGTATVSGTEQVVFTPTNTIASYDAVFTYTVSDGSLTDTATVTVTVSADNDAPTANDDTFRTGENTIAVISVLDNDSDPDTDDVLSISTVGTPITGMASISGTAIVYTPTLDFEGTDVFTYTVRDLADQSSTATVTVTVRDYVIYAPLILKKYVLAPDLVVQSLTVTSDDAQVVIENQGNITITAEFWVDVYIAPNPAPTRVNQTWQDLANYGLAWKVAASAFPNLGPGGVLTLTMNGDYYRADWSHFPRSVLVGTPVYAQVDSYGASVTYGAVLENHEISGGTYNNISSTVSTLADLRGLDTLPAGGSSRASRRFATCGRVPKNQTDES
ncbi:MAG: Ig-like domain-containing protein [Anaerolineae bacterium]